MARNKERQEEFKLTTKQWRVISDLGRVVDDVMQTCDLHGALSVVHRLDGVMCINVALFKRHEAFIEEEEPVFYRFIERGEFKYQMWVNEILQLKRAVLKFGIEYEEGEDE